MKREHFPNALPGFDFDPDLPPQVQALVGREREVACMIYGRGASTALDIENCLSVKLTNSTVRTMLARLTKKGILRRKRPMRGQGQQCIYLPTITPSHVKREAIVDLANSYFDRSFALLALEVLDLIEPLSIEERALVEMLVARKPTAAPK